MFHPTANVSEEVNRKCSARNSIVQLSTPTPTLSTTVSYRRRCHANHAACNGGIG